MNLVDIQPDWKELLKSDFRSPNFIRLASEIHEDRQKGEVYPDDKDVFNALKYTSLENTKVVILGQDPYYKEKMANGLAFSVNRGVPAPRTLINIFQEIGRDLNIDEFICGDLKQWAEQGVLLLNTVLTVKKDEPESYYKKGWEPITDRIITAVNQKASPCVFMLWGSKAQEKIPLITYRHHLVLTAGHPSPQSFGKFFGCGHFSRANYFLRSTFQSPINWGINDRKRNAY